MMNLWFLLAQAATQPAAPAARPPAASDFLMGQFLPILLFVGVFYWIAIVLPNRRERQRHESLLNSLKRNDRVQTIGGLYGTVVEVRDREVVLKIDETNNVKVSFNRGAIKEVIREGGPAAEGKK